MDLYAALRPLIFRLDPETAHNLAFWLGERACSWPWLPKPEHPTSSRRTAFGLTFPTPLGLAAGLDKGATLLPLWKSLGFGHVEIGTVTPRPQPGNPKPRLFRFPEAGLILNRMGFNSEGAEVVAGRLKHRPTGLIVGGNLGKNKETPEAQALDDYRAAYRLIAPQVDYIALNVSSPNTPGLRNLQAPEALKPLLAGMLDLRKEMGLERQPLLLKLAPDLAPEDLDAIVEVAAASGISGLVATNTTLDRGVVAEPLRTLVESKGSGGLSGVPLKAKARDIRRHILAALRGRLPLVACGGLGSAEDVQGALDDGAVLAQIYSALIFEGPSLVRRIHEGLG
ncbi:quinone-dependent dihydroorotate dehydrogenase [Geothrix fuzhouensis]|uniref:quinone-dependent dihydroorotate dehydrogenase n=1 Tax=Geothrix fuzhouensis TaxID=2966451 RepID=UPI002148924A|nr:quinone-dependent dihydroorotate dehydrogenase [Geothrix fuzhouensis]